MNRIESLLITAEKNQKKVFCGFLTAGFPSISATKQLVRGFENLGVDMLELAFPFSDPLADGPVIQKASFEAIQKGISLKQYFSIVKQLRAVGVRMPVIAFTYFNPILHFGFDAFIKEAIRSGFDGIICPDLPFGVETGFVKKVRNAGLYFIELIAPNTPDKRKKRILEATDGFVYFVSRKGITGYRKQLRSGLQSEITELKKMSRKKVFVGFGISTPEHVREMAKVADGVIVGSALVAQLDETRNVRKTLDFARELVLAARAT